MEKSFDEDRYGVVQKDLPDILVVLLQLLEALEKHQKLFNIGSKRGAGHETEDAEVRWCGVLRGTLKTALYRIVIKFGDHLE